jgi:hypothetical protein
MTKIDSFDDFRKEKSIGIFLSWRQSRMFGFPTILLAIRHFNFCPGGRVARWFVFKQKIPIWVTFGESCNGKSWHTL